MIRPRLSIRYKLLLVMAVLLLVALGSYVYLAVTLYTRDKLAYVFDANSALVENVAEQTRSSLTVLVKTLAFVTREGIAAGAPDGRAQAAALEIFAIEPDLLRVEVHAPGEDGKYEQKLQFVNEALLKSAGILASDLELSRKTRPLPLSQLAAAGTVFVQNSSLPPDLAILTVAVPFHSAGQTVIATADFQHEHLLRLFGGTGRQRTFLTDGSGEVLAHPNASQVIGRASLTGTRLVRTGLSSRSPRGALQFDAPDGEAMIGAWARVGLGDLAVFTELTRAAATEGAAELVRKSILFGVAVLLMAIIASVFLSRRLTRSIRSLSEATRRIGEGNFQLDLAVSSRDEIGDLAVAFAEMVSRIKETQRQLVQSEKMAAFGQLGAGITHEVKNPLTGIVGFAQIAQRKLNDPAKVAELLELIEKEGLRCRDILINFLKFARMDASAREPVLTDVGELVQSASGIFVHQLAMTRVKVEVLRGEGVPRARVVESELQQVLLNMAMNAQQAMPQGGKVTISTRRTEDGWAEITVEDDGPGMSPQVQEKVFEPFFTTKPAGEGTGLGLAVSFRIVRDHGGHIQVESELGKGTRFRIALPAAPGEQDGPRSAEVRHG